MVGGIDTDRETMSGLRTGISVPAGDHLKPLHFGGESAITQHLEVWEMSKHRKRMEGCVRRTVG
jgi:hypothetical protein